MSYYLISNKKCVFLYRNLKQFYVFYSLESPPAVTLRKMDLKEYNNIFNLTMTYRSYILPLKKTTCHLFFHFYLYAYMKLKKNFQNF